MLFLLEDAGVSSLFLLDDADVSSLFVLLFNDAEVSSLFLLDDADNGCMKILKFKSLFLKFYITVSGRLDQVTSRTNKKTSCALCKPPIGRTIMWSFVLIVSLQLTSGLLAGNWTTGIMVFYPTIICIYPERRGKNYSKHSTDKEINKFFRCSLKENFFKYWRWKVKKRRWG